MGINRRYFISSLLAAAGTGTIGFGVSSNHVQKERPNTIAYIEDQGINPERAQEIADTAGKQTVLKATLLTGFLGAALGPWIFSQLPHQNPEDPHL